MALLSIQNLVVEFGRQDNSIRALDGVSLSIEDGETVAVLGESGSGKSVTAQAIMGLLPRPAGRIVSGSIEFNGQELTEAKPAALRAIRGSQIAMIFQDPLSSLNPVHTVGQQIGETLRLHRGMRKPAAQAEAVELMRRVRIPQPEERVNDYPHQFSGGMRQRIMIAMAIALRPKLIIADEPTTALDVTVQAQVLELLDELQQQEGMAMILISHDLGIAASHASRVAVMYAGKIIETGPIQRVYERPAHPYTEGLLRSIPHAETPGDRLIPIPGTPPTLESVPSGCPFHPRCAWKIDRCVTEVPPLSSVEEQPGAPRAAACHRSNEVLAQYV